MELFCWTDADLLIRSWQESAKVEVEGSEQDWRVAYEWLLPLPARFQEPKRSEQEAFGLDALMFKETLAKEVSEQASSSTPEEAPGPLSSVGDL